MTEGADRRVPLVYIGIEDVPMQYANQFIIQFQQDEFILTVAQLAPPVVLGSDEERQEQVSQITHVPVKVAARFALTRARMAELVQLLQGAIERYDAAHRGGAGEGSTQ